MPSKPPSMLSILLLSSLPGLALAHGYIHPPSTALQSFDGGIAGWTTPLDANTILSHATEGGNGYLLIAEAAGAPVSGTLRLGAVSYGAIPDPDPLYGEDYYKLQATPDDLIRITLDLRNLGTGVLTPILRVDYHDDSQIVPGVRLYSGWEYAMDILTGPAWQSRAVDFNPWWTDAQATAQGWTRLQDGMVATPFSLLWLEAWTVELHFQGDAAQTLAAGMDNYRVAAVPEPAEYLFWLAALPLLVWRRRLMG